jgi:rubrerythrin
MLNFRELCRNESSRRAFLTRMAAAGLGAAALGLFDARPAQATGKPLLDIINVPDNEHFPGIPGRTKNERVLNYALTLETLEADLYRQALNLAAGKDLATPLPADVSDYALSIPTGYLPPPHPQMGFAYLQQFAAVEAAHRDFLRAAIQQMGGTPVGPNPGGYRAPFGSTLRSILEVISLVEETGVRAYLGAAGALTDLKLIQTAASIYSTEARHSSVLKLTLIQDPSPRRMPGDEQVTPRQVGEYDFEFFQTPEQILKAVQPFLA